MYQIPLCELNDGNLFPEGFLMVKSITERVSQAGKPYCDITLADCDTEMSCKLWDANRGNIKAGMVVKVRGTVQSWQNKLQMNIEKIRPIKEDDEVDYSCIVATAPFDPEEMLAEVHKYCDSIQDDGFKQIVKTILDEEKSRLLYAPGAKANHHAERAGLLHHTLGVLKAADVMCQLYEFLNRDIMISGAILHDICKLDEMQSSEIGIVSDYTAQGNLLGHLILGAVRIAQVAERLNIQGERALILQHIMVSHHGTPEFGAARPPMFPEAEMLHHLDLIDARMYDYKRALKRINKGEFTEWLRLLEKRLYKHEMCEL